MVLGGQRAFFMRALEVGHVLIINLVIVLVTVVFIVARLERLGPYGKTHGGALFILKLQLDKRGLRGQVQPVSLDITPGNRNCLDSLVDRLRPDGLNLNLALAP